MSSRFPFLCAVIVGTVLITTPASRAEATRPLIRAASIIRELAPAIPVPLKTAIDKKIIGLDVDDPAAKKLVLAQASEYVAYRRGNLNSEKWLDRCEASIGKEDASPFCRYELERKVSLIPPRGTAFGKRDLRKSGAADMRLGRYEKLQAFDYADMIGAVRHLEISGDLGEVANAVAGKNDCVPAGVAAALGFKLEENFPNTESVDLVKKLYRKGADCGKNAASAHAAFRLALIHVWQNRCADVPELVSKIETNPEGSMYLARARYWRYHCAGIAGTESEKRNAKAALIRHHPFSFQSLAAMGTDETELGRLVQAKTPQISVRSVVRTDLNPTIRAAEALIQVGASAFAAEMLDRSAGDVGALEPEVRLYLAVLLNRTGHALQKFKLLTALFQDDMRMVSIETLKLMFPLWYYDSVKSAQKTVDPLLVISLMRQESAFNREAKSIAGARGLMQVMPATARMVASVRASRLDDPTTNIAVGVKYLLKRLDQYSGDVELTLAAYNAGFARVDDWKRRYTTDNKMLFLDFIPFKETREYVSAILRNYYWYVKLYSPELAARQAAAVPQNAESKIHSIIAAQAGTAAVLGSKK